MTNDTSSASDPVRSVTPRIFLLGATGTIGKAVRERLVAEGCEVVCFLRPRSEKLDDRSSTSFRYGDVQSVSSILEDGFCGEQFDAVISCMASRTGEPKDAWAVDYQGNLNTLRAAQKVGIRQFILLSAICVQRPELAFQKAKLAFENELIASGLIYSIIRPTAFFKSLSGQVDRVLAGKPYLLFGDGEATACKPISDRDLAAYMVSSLTNLKLQNRVLPIGGPGPAITPKAQAERLFEMVGREPHYKHVPFALMDAVSFVLRGFSIFVPSLKTKAALAGIGRYYARESMLHLDPESGEYNSDATPSTGSDTLFDYYAELVAAGKGVDLKEHAVF